MWAAHDVRIRHESVKRLRHPEVGGLELAYRALDLPLSPRVVHDLTLYTAEPGTASEDRLRLLASWAATQPTPAEPTATQPTAPVPTATQPTAPVPTVTQPTAPEPTRRRDR